MPSAQPVDERVGLEPYKGVGITPFPAACPDLGMLGASWYYTWWHNARCDGYNAQFVPMVWGDWCADGSDCSALPSALAESGATTLLGFNEPDNPEQSNLSVERALQLWAVLDATPLRLGSPAVSADPPSRARAWMDEFMEGAEARGLRVDFVAAHWYGDCSSPADLVHFLNGLARYGRPVWLTEFSCWHQSEQVNQGFVETAINAVSELPWVERIAWFTNRPYAGGWEASALVSNQGQLTAVGSTFLHMPPCRDHRRLNGADHYQLTACD